MQLRKIFMLVIGAAFLLTSAGKPVATANEIDKVNKNITQQVMCLANSVSDEEEIEDPAEIFCRAIEDYKEEFDDYINITALNVVDKEDVNLSNFDINYVAPTYGEVMYEYQLNLEASLATTQLQKYDDLRKADFVFDKYVALNQNKYLDLTIPPKYEHVTTMAVVTTALVGILSGAGLTQAAISAFTGAVGTLSTAISTSWIPFVGWVLAVALAVGALIALTVIIVQYWDKICSVINEIKNWFLEQFSVFSDLINSYFSDAVAQGEVSTVSRSEHIGDKDFEFVELKEAALAEVCREGRRNSKVFLIPKKPKGEHLHIALGVPVNEQWCIDYKVLLKGYSTYTWYQNTARRLILNAGTGYTSSTPDLHLKNLNVENGDKLPKFGFSHFHNYTAAGFRDNGKPQVYAHSFFGLLKWAPNEDGLAQTYPDSPQN